MGNDQFSASGDFQLRRIVFGNPLCSRFRTSKEQRKGEKKIGKKRKEKEKKDSIVVLGGWQWREGPGAFTVCVYATGSGLTFDAFLNKGSTYLVTHVTHAGICESSRDGFKDNSPSFSRGRNFTWSCLLFFFFFHFFSVKNLLFHYTGCFTV